jgi:hypothetical protein
MDRRNAIALGAAAALGGLPAARPDQQYFPARGGQQIPGSRSGLIRAVRVIIGGTGPPSSGLFVYSPTIAAGNLVDSIAAASGTDGAFGDAVIRGIVNYFPVGSPVFAVALQDGGIVFFSAATTAGPWSNNGSIGSDAANNIRVNPAGAGNTIFASGITTGVPVSISGPESGGTPVVDITDTASPVAPIVRITSNAINDILLGGRVSGDTNARIVLDTDASGFPRIRFGSGSAAPDSFIFRGAAHLLVINNADLDINSAGRGLQIAEGANCRMGSIALAAGTITVANSTVTANTRIFLTCQVPGGTPGFLRVSARTAGTSFTILSSSGTDTSTVAWLLIEPG